MLTRYSVFEIKNIVLTDPKDRQVKHCYPEKKAVSFIIGSG